MTHPTPHPTTHPAHPALHGVRIVELGTFISAPFAATLLADFGADVLKLELPGEGDPMRTLGAYPPGGDTADLLIENFRPGTLDRWGITPAWLKVRRPDLIVVRISGFGQHGPWRDVPGFDRSAQAFSGLVHVTGEPDMPPQHDVPEIPYKSTSQAMTDLIGGTLNLFPVVVPLVAQHLQSGRAVGLAVFDTARSTLLPGLPSITEEVTVTGYIPTPVWYGFMAPTKTPRDAIAVLSSLIQNSMDTPDAKTRLAAMGAQRINVSNEQFSADIRNECEKAGAMARRLGDLQVTRRAVSGPPPGLPGPRVRQARLSRGTGHAAH